MGNDAQLRCAAFQKVRELELRFGGAIPWSAIGQGFVFLDEQVCLSSRPRGIFRPRQMGRGVLSIKTTMPREGRQRRYDDIASDEGFFEYASWEMIPRAPITGRCVRRWRTAPR